MAIASGDEWSLLSLLVLARHQKAALEPSCTSLLLFLAHPPRQPSACDQEARSGDCAIRILPVSPYRVRIFS